MKTVTGPSDKEEAPPQFGLYLAAVRIQDFRALRDVAVSFERGTTVLVGENNSGKTSLLHALAIAFGLRRARPADFFQGPSGATSMFELDLRILPMNGEEFPDSVRDIVGNAIQLDAREPDYFTIRVTGTLGAEGWDVVLSRSFLKGWAPTRAAASKLEVLKSPRVGRQALELLNFDMLDARRDIVEQMRNRRTYWGRTTSNVSIEEALKAELEDALRKLSDELTTKSGVLSRVRADLRDLSEALSQGKLEVELEALPRRIDDLIRAMDIIVTAPDSSSFPVGDQGMGTRSLAALLVFRSYVNVVRPRMNAERLLSLAAFEEPEAHLHPQAQRAIFRILSHIGGQRIVSTHSAHVASIADPHSYRLCRRRGSETVVHQVGPENAKLWNTELTRRYVQLQNPEMLFARVVAIVEGQTEASLFPELARAWWPPRGADGVGVSIVYTEGAGSSKHIVPFLDGLKIPWLLFCDGDTEADQGLRATAKILGRSLDRTSDEIVQLPAGEDLEHYLVKQGSHDAIERAANRHPKGTLSEYRARLHGQKRKDGNDRDYHSSGWEDRLDIDFLRHTKGSIGALLGEEIVKKEESSGKPVLPALIATFFSKIDDRLRF